MSNMFRYLTPFSSSSENKSEFWLGTLFVIGLGILDFGIIMPTLAALLKHLQATPGVIELNFLAYIASKFHPLMLFYTKKLGQFNFWFKLCSKLETFGKFSNFVIFSNLRFAGFFVICWESPSNLLLWLNLRLIH